MDSFTSDDYLRVLPEVREAMVRLARQFRKEPTATEHLLWQSLRGRKLAGVRFRRQQPLGPFVVDFFAASHRLIVEEDGEIHDTQREADAERQRLLESAGLRFVRVSRWSVENRTAEVLAEIRAALAESPHPPAPSPTPGRVGVQPAEVADGLPS